MAQPSIYDIQAWSAIGIDVKKNQIVKYPGTSTTYYYALKDHTKETGDFQGAYYNTEKWTKAETTINNVTAKNFLWTPSYLSSLEQQPRMKLIRLGLGVEHRALDGTNTDLKSYNLFFNDRNIYETAAILHFLHERAGLEEFVFSAPKPFIAQKMFVCEQWEAQVKPYDIFDVRTVFRQVKPEPYELIL